MAEPERPPFDEPRPSSADRSAKAEAESASWHQMAGVGVEFIAAVGLFAALGWWLDPKLGTSPWLLIAGCGLGFAVGLWQMVRTAQKLMK
jgi:ATP synthase protein I